MNAAKELHQILINRQLAAFLPKEQHPQQAPKQTRKKGAVGGGDKKVREEKLPGRFKEKDKPE
ncbi:hypothetical protein [Domibacillus robiginosus]|uniref:hypothetical protein n=1 Tax=Domibacillus robiginosus TaxID=1071054 RepID=UPI00067D2404|nr:hypothetical protein [Domibacillus robiginosus]